MSESYEKITVEAVVHASLEQVWKFWTEPAHIEEWNAASDDWHCPKANNDLRVGGEFHYLMAARDKSVEFDFSGTYTEVVPMSKISYILADDRKIDVTFEQVENGVKVTEVFDGERENPIEMQKTGWQAILNRFKEQVENAPRPQV